MKRQIEELRLKTRMSEAFNGTKVPYPRQAEHAKQQLGILQEAYKQLTGDYAKEFIMESAGRSGKMELKEFDAAFDGMLMGLKPAGIPAEIVSQLTTAYDTFTKKVTGILSLDETKIEENSYAGNITEPESKEALWHVVEAWRKDGAHAHNDAVYKDGNGSEYQIDDMWISDNGKLMAHAKEGGAIDLGVANFTKPIAFGRR